MIYTLYGENFKDIDEFIDEKVKETESNKVTYDLDESELSEAINDCNYMDLFGSKKYIVLYISSTEAINKLEDDLFIKYIDNPNEETTLFLKIITKLDERKKVTKLLREKTKFIEFNIIDEKEIENYSLKYLKEKGYQIEKDALNLLSLKINTNTILLKNELEKLLIYKEENKTITIDDIDKIVVSYSKDNLVFDLTDAIANNNKEKLFKTYKELKDNNEEPIALIALISSQIRLILSTNILLEEGLSEKDISTKLKEHPYRITLARKYSKTINKERAYKLLHLLYELDTKIKTGQIDKYRGFESFLLNFNE